ncbi:Chalcone--flavonone isomerase [Morella rubra]|uniref:Chalcone-flavonone isomerase family protein n=1 Tax=Morella rubra TaxID=262757 RepID=A0A6A1VYW4_9ROSI|nr:Chalcone--flavonone isomerase [Morella rubra]
MVNVTAIGVCLEDDALPSLAVKWRGKSAEELFESDELFRDVVKGPFEKFIQVTPFLQLINYGFAAKFSDKLIGY